VIKQTWRTFTEDHNKIWRTCFTQYLLFYNTHYVVSY